MWSAGDDNPREQLSSDAYAWSSFVRTLFQGNLESVFGLY